MGKGKKQKQKPQGRPRGKQTGSGAMEKVGFVAVWVVAIALLAAGGPGVWRDAQMLGATERTKARVVSSQRETQATYEITYRFEVDGQAYEGRGRFASPPYQFGDRYVEMTYLARDPSRSRPGGIGWGELIAFVGGLLLSGAVAYLTYQVLFEGRRLDQ